MHPPHPHRQEWLHKLKNVLKVIPRVEEPQDPEQKKPWNKHQEHWLSSAGGTASIFSTLSPSLLVNKEVYLSAVREDAETPRSKEKLPSSELLLLVQPTLVACATPPYNC